MGIGTQLLIATAMVAGTILFHLIGLEFLLSRLRPGRVGRRRLSPFTNVARILVAAFGIFFLHTVEIWPWATVFWSLGCFSVFEQALYFSTSTYVTIGYGDVVLPVGKRILGAVEGANGIILLGWSTAFFFSVVDRMKILERQLEAHGRSAAEQ